MIEANLIPTRTSNLRFERNISWSDQPWWAVVGAVLFWHCGVFYQMCMGKCKSNFVVVVLLLFSINLCFILCLFTAM